MRHLTLKTQFTDFTPCPNQLLDSPLSPGAKLAYIFLLRRAMLSRSNDWTDKNGHVFIIYPAEKLAEALGRKRTTTQAILRELEENQLIRRVKRGASMPNHIYLFLPDQCPQKPDNIVSRCRNIDTRCSPERTSDVQKTSNIDTRCSSERTSDVQKTASVMFAALNTNKIEINKTKKNKITPAADQNTPPNWPEGDLTHLIRMEGDSL